MADDDGATQVDQGERLTTLEAKVDEGFAKVTVGIAHITDGRDSGASESD